MVPLGQPMHAPFAGGFRLVSGWPELSNMKSKPPAETLHMFQTVTFLLKALALLNINAMSVTLETSQLPIFWLKSVA